MTSSTLVYVTILSNWTFEIYPRCAEKEASTNRYFGPTEWYNFVLQEKSLQSEFYFKW